MRKFLLGKGLVLVITLLLTVTFFAPSICGITESVKTDDKATERDYPESFEYYPGRFPSNSVEIEVKRN
jgi:hypothetical protein